MNPETQMDKELSRVKSLRKSFNPWLAEGLLQLKGPLLANLNTDLDLRRGIKGIDLNHPETQEEMERATMELLEADPGILNQEAMDYWEMIPDDTRAEWAATRLQEIL